MFYKILKPSLNENDCTINESNNKKKLGIGPIKKIYFPSKLRVHLYITKGCFESFLNHPPTYVRTFSLHKERENCHFLDHPTTHMTLRNIKMAPNRKFKEIIITWIWYIMTLRIWYWHREGIFGNIRFHLENKISKSELRISFQTLGRFRFEIKKD